MTSSEFATPDHLTRLYRLREPLLRTAAALLQQELDEIFAAAEHIDRISCRAKTLKSFIAKAIDPDNQPGYQNPLLEIEDQLAGRIIVFFLTDISVICDKLRRSFTPVEYRRRRPAKDEEFGYESEHLVCIVPPQLQSDDWVARGDMPSTFELQIRTIFMHAYAEPQHDIGYKAANQLPPEIRRELAWIAASSWGADQAYKRLQAWHAERTSKLH